MNSSAGSQGSGRSGSGKCILGCLGNANIAQCRMEPGNAPRFEEGSTKRSHYARIYDYRCRSRAEQGLSGIEYRCCIMAYVDLLGGLFRPVDRPRTPSRLKQDLL